MFPEDPLGTSLRLSRAGRTWSVRHHLLRSTGSKVKREPQATLPAGYAEAGGQAGFTSLEVVCVVAIVGDAGGHRAPRHPARNLAAAAPGRPADGSVAQCRSQCRATAGSGYRPQVDAPDRIIRSGADERVVQLPSDVTIRARSPAAARIEAAGATIRFLASGMSCGGVIALTRSGVGLSGPGELADGSSWRLFRSTEYDEQRADSGFTLIEALVALVVIAISLTAIELLVAANVRQQRRGSRGRRPALGPRRPAGSRATYAGPAIRPASLPVWLRARRSRRIR